MELRPLNLDIYQNNKLEYKTIYIKLQSKQNDFNDKIGFWGKGKNNIRDDWFAFRQGESLSFEFSKNKFDSVLHEWSEYKISGYIRKSKFQRLNGSIIHKRFFEYISDIEIYSKSTAQQALDRLESQRVSLEMTNWKRQLNYQEQQEQENERTALKKSRDLLKEKQEDNLKLLKGIEPKLYKLKLLLDSFSTLEIKQDSYFPNSMTFVQNPNYQGAYSFYKKINDTVGVDEDLFLQLQLVEKIGLMDMPTIYERWCLLQIIKVLVDKFRFQPEKNWKKKLANQITGDINKTRDVRIKFTNASIGREVDLWYEKILPNKKRPDFILDIKSTFNTMHTHQLIMDAKFHEKVDIEKQISLLYHTKNYSENETNTVFILHPDVNKSIKNKRTPKKWGSDAYYGEIDMFNYDWDSKNPNHKYGAILLSPITNKGGYLDNLQRLIGMSMQYNLEDNSKILLEDLEQKKKMLNPEPKEKVFCLVCGSDKLQGTKTPTNREHGYRYNFICDECEHLYEYNYCWQCHHRLIKNGAYWSYHSSQILEPFNIKCPNCSELLRL
ncbi:MAG: nuclease domain-containing protein [Campylobacterota bacterium]|nr:nuclease domain-containing protein [Campylobacterota bacterium]